MSIIPFDDRDGTIWMDGEFIDWRDAKIHILSHGLNYGSVAFEGIRSYDSKPFKLMEHYSRLHHSASMLGFELQYTTEVLIDATNELVKRNNLVNGYIRPLIWRGPETTLISGANTKIHTAIAMWEAFGKPLNPNPMRITISDWRKPAANASPYSTKVTSIYTMATIIKNDAEARGFDDAIILDGKGNITEASTSNFFAVFGDEVHTPIPDCFLNGITRQTVIDLAKRDGIKVVERKMLPSELESANAAFLTGTAAEVKTVKSIDQYEFDIHNQTVEKLKALYQAAVK